VNYELSTVWLTASRWAAGAGWEARAHDRQVGERDRHQGQQRRQRHPVGKRAALPCSRAVGRMPVGSADGEGGSGGLAAERAQSRSDFDVQALFPTYSALGVNLLEASCFTESAATPPARIARPSREGRK
jgi:hypothetical protein